MPQLSPVLFNEAPATIVAPGAIFLQGVRTIPISDIQAAGQGTFVFLVAGHMQYRDIFQEDPIHFFDWCDWAVPNDVANRRWSFITLYRNSD